MKKRQLISTFVLAAFVSILVGIFSNQSASAYMDPVVQKWIFSQYYHCFQSEVLNKNIDRNTASGLVSETIFKNNSAVYDYNYLPSENYFTSVGTTSWTSGGNDNSISCRQVLTGIDGKISGALEAAGAAYNATWSQLGNTDDVLDKLGYEAQDAETNVYFRIMMNEHNTTTITTLWSNTTESDFERGSARVQGVRDANGNIAWSVVESNFLNELKIKIDDSNRMTVTLDTPDGIVGLISGCTSSSDLKSDPIQLTNDIEQTKANIQNVLQTWIASASCSNTTIPDGGGIPTTTQTSIRYSFSADLSELIDEGKGSKFINDGSEQSALQSLIKLGHSFSTLRLSEDERYDLYSFYLKSAIPDFESSDRTKCQDYENGESLQNGLQEIHLMSGSTWYKYYVNMTNVDTSKTFRDLQPGAVFTTISLEEIIEWLNSHDAEDITTEDCEPPDTSNGTSNTTVVDVDSSDTDEVNCFNSAGALGWILCPIIDFAQHTVTAIYDSIVTQFLEVRASFLEIGNKNNGAIYSAWQTFQSIANVAFVIILLVVIFSQLTGVGIDNLGIKRVLPKLIVAAILINLSYLICELLVDISNVLGYGLNSMFSNMVVVVDGDVAAENVGTSVFSTILTGAVAGTVGGLVVTSGFLTGGITVLPIVLGLVGALISILFFFILLGVRQAAIILLIILSPLAFACYMLPNTKSIFDKWLNLMKALLLLYPLCSLVMGASGFASKILMTLDTGFLGKLIAMLVGVVPFFFLPTLLKSSMAGLGNIGARISNLGQGLSRGAQGRISNSQIAKDYQARVAAGVNSRGEQTRIGKLRSDIASGKRFSRVPGLQSLVGRSYARSLSNYQKVQDEIDFAKRPELISSEAEAKRFGRRQAAEDAILVSSGIANRTGDVDEEEFDEKGAAAFAEGTLARTAMEAARSGNVEMQYATAERMLASGHHGAEAYRQVLKALEKEGNTAAIQNFAKAGKGSRNLGDLKGGARSTYDYITDVANGTAKGSVDDYVAKTKFANMSEAQLFNTDKEELSRYLGHVNEARNQFNQAATMEFGLGWEQNEELQQTEEFKNLYNQYLSAQDQALISQAQSAYNNERLRGNAKESVQNIVADIAGIPADKRHSGQGNRLDVRNRGGNNSSGGTGNPGGSGRSNGSNGNAGGSNASGQGAGNPGRGNPYSSPNTSYEEGTPV